MTVLKYIVWWVKLWNGKSERDKHMNNLYQWFRCLADKHFVYNLAHVTHYGHKVTRQKLCLWSNCYFRYVGTCLHLQNNLFFLISCQSLKNSSRGKKRPEPKGLLNQAKKEMLPEKKTGVPAAGLKVMCLLNGNRSLQGQNSGRRVPSLHNSVFPHFGQTAMNREQNGFWGWIHFMDINP